MLVLGLASAANAVLSLTVDGGDAPGEITINPSDTIVVSIHSDNTAAYNAFFYMWDGPGTFTGPRVRQGNMSVAYGPYPSYYGYSYDYYLVSIDDSGGNLVPGSGFEVDLHCDGPGDVLVELRQFSEPYTIIDSLTIHQTPEPMTIALLGLGGLLLRRRR